MATIVMHRKTHKRYVLLGSGFGAWKASRLFPGMADAAPSDDPSAVGLIAVCGTNGILAVCSANGEIGWVPSDELTVVEVDGKTPHQLIDPPAPYR
jgi:hypothetical protein